MFYVKLFLGLGSLPWTINAEIHPAESKSISSSFAVSAAWLFSFFVTKFQPEFEHAMGASGMYFMFGSIVAVGAVLTWLFLPETKNLGEEEIRVLFVKEGNSYKSVEAEGENGVAVTC